MKKTIKSENGRSMVEMLGVLAVIGVLSVGGVAGYRMAMDKITENKIIDFFARVYLGMQSSLMNPNSSLHCCSAPIDPNSWYNRCSQDSGNWIKEQNDDIFSFLKPEECYVWYESNDGPSFGSYATKDKFIDEWYYTTLMGLSAAQGGTSASITFIFDKENVSPQMCQNILSAIIHNPVYQEHLTKLGYYRRNDYSAADPTDEKIKDVCSRTRFPAFTLYFKHDTAVNCIEETDE